MTKRGQTDDLNRYRIMRNSDESTRIDTTKHSIDRPLADVVTALYQKEGCKLKGYIPLHIMMTAMNVVLTRGDNFANQIAEQFKKDNKEYDFFLDFSHTINSLKLGNHTEENLAIM